VLFFTSKLKVATKAKQHATRQSEQKMRRQGKKRKSARPNGQDLDRSTQSVHCTVYLLHS